MLKCRRIGACSSWRVFPQVSWQTHPWEPETAWLCGIASSQDNRLGKIQQTSDHTHKQTREFEIAFEIPQCCCHASHAFQFAHVGTDESAVGKHQRTTAQDVAINCWLGASEWRGLVWDDATNESQTQCGFGTLPYSTMDGTTCQSPMSQFAAKIASEQSWSSIAGHWICITGCQANVDHMPSRKRGRPLVKWDDKLSHLTHQFFPLHSRWLEAAKFPFWQKCSAVLCFTFCGPLGLHIPHVPMGS